MNGSQKQIVTRSAVAVAEDSGRVHRAPGTERQAFISFASVHLHWKIIAPNGSRSCVRSPERSRCQFARWHRRIGRDVMAVHGDVHGLIDAGMASSQTPTGVRFGYDAVHVDFTLDAA